MAISGFHNTGEAGDNTSRIVIFPPPPKRQRQWQQQRSMLRTRALTWLCPAGQSRDSEGKRENDTIVVATTSESATMTL